MRWCTPTASASAYRVFCARANSALHNTTGPTTNITRSLNTTRRRYSASHAYAYSTRPPSTPPATGPSPRARPRSGSGSLQHSYDPENTHSSLVSVLLSSKRPFAFDRALSDSQDTQMSRDRPPPRPPELALAAAQAVRLAMARKMPYQAKSILRALLPPVASGLDSTLGPSPQPSTTLSGSAELDLQGVSPRPASHAYIHSLLRNNQFEKAAEEATRLLEAGVRLHVRTLEFVIKGASLGGLDGSSENVYTKGSTHTWHERAQRSWRVVLATLTAPSSSSHPDIPHSGSRTPHPSSPSPDFDINPETIKHRGTRLAITLLAQARREQHHRTEHMFASLVHAVLLRGQLAFASVLIAVLVRDWQLRKAAVAAWEAACDAADSADHAEDQPLSPMENGAPSPKSFSLWPILRRTQDILSSPGVGRLSASDPHVVESAQALAILAHLLDARALPFGSVAGLIRACYAFPDVRVRVWVPPDPAPVPRDGVNGDGKWRSVDAYEYLHAVLYRLASSPPPSPPTISSMGNTSKHPELLPPLDLKSYNALLHYALRHRRSPALASSLLKHMTEVRRGPLRPDAVTANIVMRGGTILRRGDMSAVALGWLRMLGEDGAKKRDREKDEAEEEEEFVVPAALDPKEYARNAQPKDTEVSTERAQDPAPEALLTQPDVPDSEDAAPEELLLQSLAPTIRPDGRHRPLTPDSHSLVTYITHLTATGHPSSIVEPLFQLLPELLFIEHPSVLGAQPPTPSDAARVRHEGRLRALERGVRLGPHFFTAVLNALSKAGRTGLTERTWLFARECEALSFRAVGTREGMAKGLKPWVLPVAAYTAVMQRYAEEARKGMLVFRDGDARAKRAYLAALDAEARAGESLVTGADAGSADGWRRSQRPVKGWAKVVLSRHAMHPSDKHGNARERRFKAWRAGLSILRALSSAADEMRSALVDIRAARQRILEEARDDPNATLELGDAHADVEWAGTLEPAARADARFFNAALSLAAWRRSPSALASGRNRTVRRTQAKRTWRRAQRRYASHGETPVGWTPVLQAVAEELVGAGFRVPLGLRYLFVGKELPVPRGEREQEQEAVVPYFARRKAGERMPFRARALQTRKTRGLCVSSSKRRLLGRTMLGHAISERSEMLDSNKKRKARRREAFRIRYEMRGREERTWGGGGGDVS